MNRSKPIFLKIALYLASLNFITENMGNFPSQLNLFFGFILLFVFLGMSLPVTLTKTHLGQYCISALLFLAAFAMVKIERMFTLFAVALLILSLRQSLSTSAEKQPELTLAYWTSIYYAMFVLVDEYVSHVWILGQKISDYLVLLLNAVMPNPIDYGVTYTGLKLTASFYLLCLVATGIASKRKMYLNVRSLFFFLALTVIYVFIHSQLMLRIEEPSPSTVRLLQLNSQCFLFIILLLPLYHHLRSIAIKRPFWPVSVQSIIILSVVVTITIAERQGLLVHHHAANAPGKVVFFDEGYLDWNVPVFGSYGGRNGGMFGVLIQYLRANNYDVVISGVTKEALAGADTLVFINLNRSLAAVERDLVWQFVNAGGALLVLGDHTGVDAIRKPYNELLSPVHISFNFDSAISLAPKWANGFEMRHHFITQHLKNEDDLQIWIGASLDISYPARPVIIGKYAFSDRGNVHAAQRGYLGDMRYARGERLGDVVLVAENTYGDGKVLVFGDTSSFQNSAIALSSPFVDNVFDWLGSKKSVVYPSDDVFLSIMMLLAIAQLTVRRPSAKRIMQALLGVCGLVTMALMIADRNELAQTFDLKTAIAYVDISHLERVNRDLWGDPDGFGGLTYNLIRNGYFPKVLKTFDTQRINRATVLILIAPAKPFSDEEIEAIEGFIRQGGYLILTVGWEEKAGSQGLLDRFRINISNTPLGRISPEQNAKGITFLKAWPVIAAQKNVETLCTVWGYPVMVFSGYGKGGVVVVGDSSFMLNRNLEGLHHYFVPNINALRELFSTNLNLN